MNATHWILASIVVLSALYWASGAWGLYQLRRLPRLAAVRVSPQAGRRRVSLVIPARDEADTLEKAVRSRLAEGDPALEVLLVDDRSQDGTSERVDRLAEEDPRIRAIHVTQLPEGWLGKVHALHVGAQAATGEWILFTDADVHFAPGTIRKAIALCESRNWEFASVLFKITRTGFVLDTVHSALMRLIGIVGRLHQVENARSSACMGAGAFNLVRRNAFERTSGFETLRLAVADDVAFGQLMKRSGLRCGVANGLDHVQVALYSSLEGFMRGAEKNGFAVMGGYSQTRLAWACLVYLLLECGLILGLLCPGAPSFVQAASAATLLLALGTTVLAAKVLDRPLGPTVVFPLGVALYLGAMARSGWFAWKRGGVMWRGTLYETERLRAAAKATLS